MMASPAMELQTLAPVNTSTSLTKEYHPKVLAKWYDTQRKLRDTVTESSTLNHNADPDIYHHETKTSTVLKTVPTIDENENRTTVRTETSHGRSPAVVDASSSHTSLSSTHPQRTQLPKSKNQCSILPPAAKRTCTRLSSKIHGWCTIRKWMSPKGLAVIGLLSLIFATIYGIPAWVDVGLAKVADSKTDESLSKADIANTLAEKSYNLTEYEWCEQHPEFVNGTKCQAVISHVNAEYCAQDDVHSCLRRSDSFSSVISRTIKSMSKRSHHDQFYSPVSASAKDMNRLWDFLDIANMVIYCAIITPTSKGYLLTRERLLGGVWRFVVRFEILSVWSTAFGTIVCLFLGEREGSMIFAAMIRIAWAVIISNSMRYL
ncbi:hypothetical protein CC80DRAFT_223390 [Byssothecium circinans]|uniref:Uncharacterized protein n=1 Tax=Byssothecium circinans TaxID=147558 RepID=A0A6A5TJ49_9PLEO|nr:hypothetical protein CC80DRAFT_555862 [Byssothecium circinans]KAF1950836.1 hypothetical protein CC80DRAFT_223390 [Byssothecium circinans]